MLLYHAAIRLGGREDYRTVTAVGYSCVLFGWMTVLAVRQPAGITMLPLFGLANLPMYLAPFGSLVITSLLFPRASFVGHLAGILAGYVISIPVFDHLPAIVPVVALALAGVGMAADYFSRRGGGGGDLTLPFLPQWVTGRGGADLESAGSGGRGPVRIVNGSVVR